jgi:hypothetical protein
MIQRSEKRQAIRNMAKNILNSKESEQEVTVPQGWFNKLNKELKRYGKKKRRNGLKS